MKNIMKLICTKNKISYIVFDKEFKVLDFNNTIESVVDDVSSMMRGLDIREILWEIIGLEDELMDLYNNLSKENILHFPMILKKNEYYDLDIETFISSDGKKLFIAYAIQKQKESLAYINMIKEINKKTLIYENQDTKYKEHHFDLINQKLLSFNVDMDGLITSVNNAFLLFFDKAINEIVGKHFSLFFKARDFNINANSTIIFNAINTSNEIISFHANIIPVMENDVAHENIVLCQDITYLKQIEEELKFAAFHDSLTGLPNRSYILKKIDETIKVCDEKKQSFNICFIDLNKFKPINDNYGHHAGDMLLKHVAKILSSFIRKDDLVARIGGDEFIILFNTIDDEISIQDMEKRLLDLAPKHPLVYSEEDIIEFSFSLGIASYPEDAQDAPSLIKIADKEMYIHKQRR